MSQTAKEIIRALPERLKKEKVGDYETTIHLELSGDGGGRFTVVIQNGACTIADGLHGEAKCVVKAKAKTYRDIELGKTNPQTAFMLRKIKISNLPEMMQFTKMFYSLTAPRKTVPKTTSKPQKIEKAGPLVGIRVLDLTRLYPGPLATMLMADMGADVIKIENMHSPDYIRSMPPFIGEESAAYIALNRSKRSLALDFRKEEGREIFFDLVRNADLVVEGFRPGVLAKTGMGYESAKAVNAKIIYISVTGYGQTGPYANDAGHDINYIGYTGILDLNGTDDGGPLAPGVQMADVAGGAYMTMVACLSALWARERSGKGQYVDVAMTDAVLPLMTLQLAQFWGLGRALPRDAQLLSGGLASYGTYECRDGKFVALGALEARFWNRFREIIKKPKWQNLSYAQGDERDEIREELKSIFKTKTRKEWLTLVQGEDTCLTPVLSLDELRHDAHLQARKMFVEQDHPVAGRTPAVGIPLKFSQTPARITNPAPGLGEHSREILEEIGYGKKKIDGLIQAGIARES